MWVRVEVMSSAILACFFMCATKKLLLLDEPVTGLDPVAQNEMYNLIKLINLCDGITVIMTRSGFTMRLTERAAMPSKHSSMTGEISLRGQVLPIGGLPEKLMAAERAGVKTVLIPKENERDLEDVPKETRDRLKIIPVSTAEEVIRQALHVRLPIRNLHPFSGNGEIPYALPKIVTRLT